MTHCWATASCDDNKVAQTTTVNITQYLQGSAISSNCYAEIKIGAAIVIYMYLSAHLGAGNDAHAFSSNRCMSTSN